LPDATDASAIDERFKEVLEHIAAITMGMQSSGERSKQIGNALITGYPYMQGAQEIQTESTGGEETRPRNYAVVLVMRIE
jgi:hypothetical protein